MTRIGTQYRQGDVLLTTVSQLPPGLESMPLPADGMLTLLPPDAVARESHCLAVRPGLQLFRAAGRDGPAEWLRCDAPVVLRHPEHASLTLEPGCWRITPQRRYVPTLDRAATRLALD